MEYIGWIVIGLLAMPIVGMGFSIGMNRRSRVERQAFDLAKIIHQWEKIEAQSDRVKSLRDAFVDMGRAVDGSGKNKDYPIAAMVDALKDAEQDLVWAKYGLVDAKWRITQRQLKDRGREILSIGPDEGRKAQ